MEPIVLNVEDLENAIIPIGKVAENLCTQVQINCKARFDKYPTAVVTMAVTDPTGLCYPVVIVRDGDIVKWDVKNSDLTTEGLGKIQLTFTVDSVVKKSDTAITSIKDSILLNGTSPNPLEDFIAEAEEALEAIPTTINTALAEAKASGEFDGPPGADGKDGIDGKDGKDGKDGIDGKDGEDGKDGADGAPGQDGQDGTSAYVHIRYAASQPSSDSDMKTTADAWIGVYSGTSSTAPTHYTDYTWYKYKGEPGQNGQDGAPGADGKDGKDGKDGANGTNGQDGQDGISAYVYIRYSATEPSSDSDMKTTPDEWIGFHSGSESSAPTHYTDYTWYKIKGETPTVPVTDVQLNGTSILNQGVANIPPTGASQNGYCRIDSSYGINANAYGRLYVQKPTEETIKWGEHQYMPIVPYNQHLAVWAGLAKAAGIDIANVSGISVGQYPANVQAAIQAMFGVENGVSFVEEVSGSTPTIVGVPNVKYECGELTSLTLTAPENGTIDVWFMTGSTPTMLTLSGVVFPEWFDTTSLEANTVYEFVITDGYGGVSAWERPVSV